MGAISDDYEDFETVASTAAGWAEEDGLRVFGRQELLSELADLIRTGYAQAYILSAQPPHTRVADYSEGRADDLWFLLTAAGIRALNELDAQPDGG